MADVIVNITQPQIAVNPVVATPTFTVETSNVSGTVVDLLLQAHEDDETPHPAYDDLPSFTLIFENGLI